MFKKNRYIIGKPLQASRFAVPKKRLFPVVVLALAVLFSVFLYTRLTGVPDEAPLVTESAQTPDSEVARADLSGQESSPDADSLALADQGQPDGAEEAYSDEDAPLNEHRGVIESGMTAGQLLTQWMSPQEAHNLVEACKPVYGLHNLRAGQPYFITADEARGFARLEYEIDGDERLIITCEDGSYKAQVEKIHYDIVLLKVEGTIQSNLFSTMSELGESAALAVRLADIFAWEINFIRSIQPGDSFRLLVEKRYRDGEFKGYGKMPMAVFVNEGREHDAFLFEDAKGRQAYFNAEGQSLRRAFLKAPLSYTRISSRFSPKRLHPILKTWRAHPAVDYAAPSGTPVKAIGRGQVAFAGSGKGAGNYVSIKHVNGYESSYLHLKGFAKGVKKGVHVEQGQIIGYVGSTGYSTGPHLDFRMKKDGSYINPEKHLAPRDEPVTKAEMIQFKKNRDTWQAYMDGQKPREEYSRGVADARPADEDHVTGG